MSFLLTILIFLFIFSSNCVYISPNSTCQICDGTINFPYPNIKIAIDSLSSSHGVLTLLNGNYNGSYNTNIVLSNMNLNITSLNGPESTIIDCNGNGFGFSCLLGVFYIENITLINCNKQFSGNPSLQYSGGAVSVNQGILYLKYVSIINSYASYGGGLACFSSICNIDSSIFVNNSAFKDGGAIYCSSSTLQILSNTQIINNCANISAGGIYANSGSFNITGQNIVIENNTFSGNNILSQITGKKVNIIIDIDGSTMPVNGVECSTQCIIIQNLTNINGSLSDCLCPNQYYSFISQTCTSCPLNISNCEANTSCIVKCQNNQCICMSDSYCNSTGGCSLCHDSCSTCTGATEYNCTSCSDINAILDINTGQCICKAGFFLNSNFSCSSCFNSCLNCTGPENNQCLNCNYDYVFRDGFCVNNCDTNEYISSNNTCFTCDDTCLSCFNGTLNSCLTCYNGFSINNYNQCVHQTNNINIDSNNNPDQTPNITSNNTSNNILESTTSTTTESETSITTTDNNNSSKISMNDSIYETNHSVIDYNNFSINIDFNLFYTKQLNVILIKFCDNYTILSEISMNDSQINIESFSLSIDFNYFIEKQSITQYLIHLFYLKPLCGGKLLNVTPPALNKTKSIKLFDFDQLDPTEVALFKSFSQQGEIIEISSKLMFLTNSLSSSSGGATPGVLRNMMLLELIFSLKFIDLNYPPNLIEFFIERTEGHFDYLYKYKFDIDDEDELKIPSIYQLYDSSPYFLDNAGDLILQSILFYLIGLICLLILKYNRLQIENSVKTQSFFKRTMIKMLIVIKDSLVWEFPLLLFFTNFQEIFFRIISSMKFPTFSVYKGALNFFFAIFTLLISIPIFKYFLNINKIIHQHVLLNKYDQVFPELNYNNFFKKTSISWNPLKIIFRTSDIGKIQKTKSNKIIPLEKDQIFEKNEHFNNMNTRSSLPSPDMIIKKFLTQSHIEKPIILKPYEILKDNLIADDNKTKRYSFLLKKFSTLDSNIDAFPKDFKLLDLKNENEFETYNSPDSLNNIVKKSKELVNSLQNMQTEVIQRKKSIENNKEFSKTGLQEIKQNNNFLNLNDLDKDHNMKNLDIKSQENNNFLNDLDKDHNIKNLDIESQVGKNCLNEIEKKTSDIENLIINKEKSSSPLIFTKEINEYNNSSSNLKNITDDKNILDTTDFYHKIQLSLRKKKSAIIKSNELNWKKPINMRKSEILRSSLEKPHDCQENNDIKVKKLETSIDIFPEKLKSENEKNEQNQNNKNNEKERKQTINELFEQQQYSSRSIQRENERKSSPHEIVSLTDIYDKNLIKPKNSIFKSLFSVKSNIDGISTQRIQGNNMHKIEILKERYSILYEDYKTDTFLQRNFLFFDLFRQILIILIVVSMFPLAFIQIIIINIIQIIYLIFCYFIKPFETRFLKVNFAISEIIITIAFMSCLIIGIYDKIEMYDMESREKIGFIVPYCNLALLYWMFSTMFFKIVYKIIFFLRKPKNRVIPVF